MIDEFEIFQPRHVLVRGREMNAKTKGGIIVHLKMGDDTVHPNVYGEVLEVGAAVDEVAPGDLVLFERYAGQKQDGEKFGYPATPGERRKEFFVMDIDDIQAVVEYANG